MKDFVASHTGRRFFDNFGRLVDQLERLVNHLTAHKTHTFGGPMPIAQRHMINFETLMAAAKVGDLCLFEVYDKQTGEPVTVICAAFEDEEKNVNFVPLARMFEDDPYNAYVTEPKEATNPFAHVPHGVKETQDDRDPEPTRDAKTEKTPA